MFSSTAFIDLVRPAAPACRRDRGRRPAAARRSSRRPSRRCRARRRPTRARGRCSRRRRRAATSECRADRARAVESITRGSSTLQRRRHRRVRSGREDRVLERERLLAAGGLLHAAACAGRRSRRGPGCSCTLRCFTSWPVPVVRRLTTSFLNSRSLSRSIFGSPNSTPHAFA